jgi:excinuclease ABC subunit C
MQTEDYQQLGMPPLPGVYRFVGANDTVLYVGKAKNLKNRVGSYFGERQNRLAKTKAMVKAAVKIEYTIVESEQDALFLESNLIKKYQPKYNVLLKDGKSYPYIAIQKERFPRVFITRQPEKERSTLFGPYVSTQKVELLMDLFKQLFPLRTCIHALTETNITQKKFKVCLEYHIKNCLGACVGLESEADYMEKITQITNVLKGQFGAVSRSLKKEMMAHAEKLEFEKAQQVKERLKLFEDYQSKSTIVSTTIVDADVFAIAGDEKTAFVHFLKVVNGAVIHSFNLELAKQIEEETDDSLLERAIPYLRQKFDSQSKEFILSTEAHFADKSVLITVPKIGDKRKLVELAAKNAKFQLLQHQKQAALKTGQPAPAERILLTLQKDLRMKHIPLHIECFDNSNLQGTNPVSSCVVFINGKPAKREYRHFNIKTVEGPDDFASMEEVVMRRYKRRLAEAAPLPQLIIIDGGKGQLSAAMKSLTALDLHEKVTVIGIAKQLEEIFFPLDSIPLYIDKKSESLKLIQQCRNEAHRFAITFHRDQRSKNFITSELTDIQGIGDKLTQKLLTHFGSAERVKQASEADLEMVIGKAATQKMMAWKLTLL